MSYFEVDSDKQEYERMKMFLSKTLLVAGKNKTYQKNPHCFLIFIHLLTAPSEKKSHRPISFLVNLKIFFLKKVYPGYLFFS